MPEEIALLTSWYGLSPESAAELIAELPNKKSLESLAGYRVARAENPPNKSLSVGA
jgi:hypothetical protein